jgi:hypothetical protein
MSSLGMVKDIPITSVAVAYDCPHTHTTYILLFHQVLYMEEMSHALINPNQLRYNGLQVNEVPFSFLPPNMRTRDCHSIISTSVRIPLKSKGVISYFECRRPTIDEMNDNLHYPRSQ